jgi:HSP20 family protein
MKGTKELVKAESPRLLAPFEEIERWFENAWLRPSSLFGPTFWPTGRLAEMKEVAPSCDMYEEGNELVVKADLPGVKKEDIKVDVSGNMITISGEKKKEEKSEQEGYYRFERSYGSFYRRFDLPEGLDTDKVKAHYEDGVLEVRIPKTEEAVKKAKHIPIE